VNDDTCRTVVVTGGSSGIGLAAATAFAAGGARVGIVGRDRARLDEALSLVRAVATGPQPSAFQADFAELAQVRTLAERLAEAYPSIDVLANNAGGVFPKRVTTVDGFEKTMAVNHLAPFLLTHLLLDRLSGGRVVNTASAAHLWGRLDPAGLDSAGRYFAFPVYGTSKQANILFTAEAARRWPQVSSYCFHPGTVRTRFGRDNPLVRFGIKLAVFLRTPEKGAETLVWLAGRPVSELASGGYYVDRRQRTPARAATDPQLAVALWSASEAAVGL
jgi:NAD(P)-dependent dehydrogenase (short-subunit alcohol dehydrogenase family)